MEKYVVFGAGQRGKNFVSRYRKQYLFLGFLDNNSNIHGASFNGLEVYHPNAFDYSTADKIIIASDYYPAIYEQLKHKLNISDQKIVLDLEFDLHNLSFVHRFKALMSPVFRQIEKYLAPALPMYRSIINKSGIFPEPLQLRPLNYLDNQTLVEILRPEQKETHVGPNWFEGTQFSEAIQIPKVAIYEFKNSWAFATGSHVISNDGDVIIELNPKDDGQGNYSNGILAVHGKKNALIRNKETVETIESGIFINCFAPKNYFHWVIELFPKLKYALECQSLSEIPILLPECSSDVDAFSSLLAQVIPPEREVVYLKESRAYHVAHLYQPSSPCGLIPNLDKGTYIPNFGYYRHEALNFIRNAALNVQKETPQKILPKRIFLARKGVLRRYNQDQIFALFEPLGFELVFPEALSFVEQVQLFNGAEIVVGPTGAAWVGLLYMKQNTKGLCWMATEYGDINCYSQLAYANAVDLDYIPYTTGAHNPKQLYYKSYHLDPAAIKKWIDVTL